MYKVFDAYEFMKRVADNSLKGLEINEGDYYEDGYWICGKCGERKQEQVEMEGHEPILRARQCRCMREVLKREEEEKKRREEEDRIKYLRETCGLGERYRDARFENWREDLRKEKSYRYCKSYAERFDEMLKKNQGLLLWGDVGSGKSWAAACIVNYLVDHGISACMTSSMSIVEDDMKLSMAKLLVIDDFGAERKTDYASEKLFRVLDYRYNNKKPIIITTNLSLKEMKDEVDLRYDRMYDRIFEICFPIAFVQVAHRKEEAKRRYNEMEKLLGGSDIQG